MTINMHEAVMVDIADLKEHPRNYRDHPDDQLDHLAASITEHGFYRNIVVANDLTILAGHGVVKAAAEKLGLTAVPVITLPVGPDSPQALKVLTGDNELSRLAGIDDRLLSELLKEINDDETASLLGTGYDEAMLANLVLVTRPASEIKDPTQAGEWVGMPGYDGGELAWQILVSFGSKQERDEFKERGGFAWTRVADEARVWSARWPEERQQDVASLKFKEGEPDAS